MRESNCTDGAGGVIIRDNSIIRTRATQQSRTAQSPGAQSDGQLQPGLIFQLGQNTYSVVCYLVWRKGELGDWFEAN